MNQRSPVAAGLSLFFIATASAQMWTHENSKHDFRIKVPKFMKEMPLEPGEEQILAKFAGTAPSPDAFFKGDRELIYMVVRIQRTKAAATGAASKPTAADVKSFQEQAKEQLNSGTTLEAFLERRGIRNTFDAKPKLTKPVKNRAGENYVVREI